MKWRCIDTGYNNAFYNMALDEFFLEQVSKGESMPILRFYSWKPVAISLGYFQKVNSSIDVEFCRKNGIDIVRRITGGRTVLHYKELTYSIVIPDECEFVKGSITEAYKKISTGLLEGLKLCGINAEFSPGILHSSGTSACFESSSKYEIVIGGKKLVGSAQTRKKGVVLQHGSIVIDFDPELFAGCLGIGGDKKEEFLKEYMNRAASISLDCYNNVNRELLINKIKQGFAQFVNIDIAEQNLTKKEENFSKILFDKYLNKSWNFSK